METRSLKTLSLLRLHGNSEGNSKETSSFLTPVINRSKNDTRETFSEQSYRVSREGKRTETSDGNLIRKVPPVNPAGSIADDWPEPMAGLVRWFENADLPQKPFSPSGYEHILRPATYYEALRRDIRQGPKTPRARYGALQSDLKRLKDYCKRRADS